MDVRDKQFNQKTSYAHVANLAKFDVVKSTQSKNLFGGPKRLACMPPLTKCALYALLNELYMNQVMPQLGTGFTLAR
jgi:hypothetical protein